MHFLFEGRVPEDGAVSEEISPAAHYDTGDIYAEAIGTPITEVVVDSVGSNVPKPQERAPSLQTDCVLLNVLSTLIALDVGIVDLVVALPLHAAARHWRWEYERNRHWQESWIARLP